MLAMHINVMHSPIPNRRWQWAMSRSHNCWPLTVFPSTLWARQLDIPLCAFHSWASLQASDASNGWTGLMASISNLQAHFLKRTPRRWINTSWSRYDLLKPGRVPWIAHPSAVTPLPFVDQTNALLFGASHCGLNVWITHRRLILYASKCMHCHITLGASKYVDTAEHILYTHCLSGEEGKVSGNKYKAIRRDLFHPMAKHFFPDGCGLFQGDNDPMHRAWVVFYSSGSMTISAW